MKFMIGVDIESINRFKNLDYKKDRKFLEKIFTAKELKYCFSKKSVAQHLAVRFAGKEAILKALSDIPNFKLQYKEIEILNKKNGAPIINLKQRIFQELKFHISLSHNEENAIAFVMVNYND